jgi:tetratricopeptide (TPR) repeat protein/S1-C subfamily serine protease
MDNAIASDSCWAGHPRLQQKSRTNIRFIYNTGLQVFMALCSVSALNPLLTLYAIATPAFSSPAIAQSVPQTFTEFRQNGVKIGPSVQIGPGVVLPPPLMPPTPSAPVSKFPVLQSATTPSSGTVAQQAKAVTVLIQNNVESGSGVLIQQKGKIYTVLTAAHVVHTPATYSITTVDGQKHSVTASEVQSIRGVDLAILRFQSDRAYSVANIGSSQTLTEGNPVYVAGFPLGTAAITQPVYNFTDGKVTARSGKAFADGYAMVYTNNTLPGMSGGGVFNPAGQLVGIHGRGDVDSKLESSSVNSNIRIKTGFNLGIPIEAFLNRAKEMGITININIIQPSNPPSSPVDDSVVAAALKAQQGDYPAAIALMNSAIQQSPNSAKLYFARANYYISANQIAAALLDLDRTIKLDPSAEAAYTLRGSYRNANRDTVGATADFSQAIKLNSKNIQAYTMLAVLHIVQGDTTAAIADYTNMIRIDPKNSLAYSMRAGMYWQQGNKKEAIADISKLISFNPSDIQAYQNRAHFRKYSDDVAGAIADYTTIIKLNPRYLGAYEARVDLKKEMKDINGAIADYGEMIKVAPQGIVPYMEQARLYLEQNQYSKAIANYTKLIELEPSNTSWYDSRGDSRQYAGDRLGASADFKKAAELALKKGNREDYERWMKQAKEAIESKP